MSREPTSRETMSRERYVIVGLAKTGTTAIAMTLRNTLRIEGFHMEPQDLATLGATRNDRVIIKLLFDHWVNRADQLREFLCGTNGDVAPTTILVVRDPRDEAISRLYYFAYNYFSTRPTTEDDRASWLEIFRQKEATPQSIGLIDMQNQLIARFGLGFLINRQIYEAYLQLIDDVIGTGKNTAHLLRYEDFVARTIKDQQLQTLLAGSREVGATFRRVYRAGSSGQWRTFLTDDDLAALNNLCEPLLRRFDYPFEREAATAEAGANTLSRRTGSDYVDNLITEARRDYLAQTNNVPAPRD